MIELLTKNEKHELLFLVMQQNYQTHFFMAIKSTMVCGTEVLRQLAWGFDNEHMYKAME